MIKLISRPTQDGYVSRADRTLIGSMGTVHTPQQVKINGVYWKVTSSYNLHKGMAVKVVSRKGTTLTVIPIKVC